MRSFIVAIIVALLLGGGAVGYAIYVDNAAHELDGYIEQIVLSIDNEDYEAAGKTAYELINVVEEKKEILGAIADHEEIYEIERTLAQLLCYAAERDSAESRACCATVSALIDRLSGNSSPAIFNIL